MKKSLISVTLPILLSACAPTGLYQWGSYESSLYASYKDVSKTEALKNDLIKQIGESEKNKSKVAPGLYAELGTLFLKSGDAAQAAKLYTKEKETWPESTVLMDALISSANKAAKKSPEQAK